MHDHEGHDHGHAHDHGHGFGHSHAHGVTDFSRAFAVGVSLNLGFVIVEAGYGFAAGSLALLADAGHNLSDVASLLLAWGAATLAKRAASERRTYGLRKATVLAALASAVLLLLALGGITWESINRFANPAPVEGMTVIVVAAIGVVINTVTALMFMRGQHDDLNVRGAFLHMAADAAVSLGVVVAGVIIWFKGWLWVDPVISLAIVAIIFIGTWGLLRESLDYALDAVPSRVDMARVQAYLLGLPGVDRMHDLHVWPLSTTEIGLTVHLVIAGEGPFDALLHRIQHDLDHDHGIGHVTVQIESAEPNQPCARDGDGCAAVGSA